MINYFNYYTEVEEFFLRMRGRNLLVSPLDWCLIELWKENGIPLHVVLRGIERSFESAARRRNRPPTTLFYCHPGVMEAFGEYQEAMLGAPEPAQQNRDEAELRNHVLQHLDRLLSSLTSCQEDCVELACNRLKALREEVASRNKTDLAETDRALAQINAFLVDRLLEGIPPEERRLLNKRVRDELKIYKKRISAEMYARMQEGYRQRLVREEFGIPDLSLLEMPGDS